MKDTTSMRGYRTSYTQTENEIILKEFGNSLRSTKENAAMASEMISRAVNKDRSPLAVTAQFNSLSKKTNNRIISNEDNNEFSKDQIEIAYSIISMLSKEQIKKVILKLYSSSL